MSLDQLIGPEIRNDEFSSWIKKLIAEQDVSTVLEIGSSAGDGSTAAFAEAILAKGAPIKLFCLEVSKARFAALKARYQHTNFVVCRNASSVGLEEFPTVQKVTDFYNAHRPLYAAYPLDMVLGWLAMDRQYVADSGVEQNGIEIIRLTNLITHFDIVLIDGSEFLGEAELEHVIGAKFILLDDVNAFKNMNNRARLLQDSRYYLLHENFGLRNGFSIFQRKL